MILFFKISFSPKYIDILTFFTFLHNFFTTFTPLGFYNYYYNIYLFLYSVRKYIIIIYNYTNFIKGEKV